MALVIMGCGGIARRHAAAARRLRMPVIFASRDAARARAYASAFGGVGAYGDYAAALRDRRAAGAIVCTPTTATSRTSWPPSRPGATC